MVYCSPSVRDVTVSSWAAASSAVDWEPTAATTSPSYSTVVPNV